MLVQLHSVGQDRLRLHLAVCAASHCRYSRQQPSSYHWWKDTRRAMNAPDNYSDTRISSCCGGGRLPLWRPQFAACAATRCTQSVLQLCMRSRVVLPAHMGCAEICAQYVVQYFSCFLVTKRNVHAMQCHCYTVEQGTVMAPS